MRLLPLTLPTPSENLALDEALLELAESEGAVETLRLWESPEPVVVMGRSSRVQEEVNLGECQRRGVPVLRRVSGGASIVAGPGCLMYALALSVRRRPELQAVDQAHATALDPIAQALAAAGAPVVRDGTSDLALDEPTGGPRRKFSGNSLRVKRGAVLYHGTLLYDFDLPLVDALLRTPPRQPAYREGRDHGAFVTNLPLDGGALRQAVTAAWTDEPPSTDYPAGRVEALVRERYGRDEWHLSR